MKRVIVPALLFPALLLVYAMLRQDVQYGDGISFLVQLHDRFLCSHNWLYLPAMDLFARALRTWASEPVAAGLFSGACAAGGGALVFAWLLRVGQDQGLALLATLLVAWSPAILFYGTTIENHAHHLLWVGALLLALRAASVRSGTLPVLLPGLLLIGVFGSHQTSILLVPGVALLFLAWRAETAPLRVAPASAQALLLVLPLLLVKLTRLDRWLKAEVFGGGAEFWTDEGAKVFFEQIRDGAPVAAWPDYWWSDVLQPAFGLVALAALGAVLARRRRFELLAVAAALVPYLLFFARWHIPERGAYYTAVWPLLALCVVRGLGQLRSGARALAVGICLLAIAAQAWVGLARIREFEREDPYRSWVQELRAAVQPGGFLLLANDIRALHAKYWAGLDTMQAQALRNQVFLSEAAFPGALQRFPPTAVADLTARAQRHQELLVEGEAWQFLEHDWPDLAHALDAGFRRTPLPRAPALALFRLEPR